MIISPIPWCVGIQMSITGNYRDSCEVGSDPLTTKVFTSRHVHLKQQDIYATGGGPKKETVLKRDMLGGREYFLSSHSVNYNPEKVQHSFTEHLLNATHYVFIWLSLNPRSRTARYVLLFPFRRNRNGKKIRKVSWGPSRGALQGS